MTVSSDTRIATYEQRKQAESILNAWLSGGGVPLHMNEHVDLGFDVAPPSPNDSGSITGSVIVRFFIPDELWQGHRAHPSLATVESSQRCRELWLGRVQWALSCYKVRSEITTSGNISRLAVNALDAVRTDEDLHKLTYPIVEKSLRNRQAPPNATAYDAWHPEAYCTWSELPFLDDLTIEDIITTPEAPDDAIDLPARAVSSSAVVALPSGAPTAAPAPAPAPAMQIVPLLLERRFAARNMRYESDSNRRGYSVSFRNGRGGCAFVWQRHRLCTDRDVQMLSRLLRITAHLVFNGDGMEIRPEENPDISRAIGER
jgi:hypothetical protein